MLRQVAVCFSQQVSALSFPESTLRRLHSENPVYPYNKGKEENNTTLLIFVFVFDYLHSIGIKSLSSVIG